MEKSVIVDRHELAIRWARAVQLVSGGVAVSLVITWGDENEDVVDGESHAATAYGETSKGRHLSQLPLEVSFDVAEKHLQQAQALMAQQYGKMRDTRKAAAEREAHERVEKIRQQIANDGKLRDAMVDQQEINNLDSLKDDVNRGIAKPVQQEAKKEDADGGGK